ncbi:MAG: hypothetical protein V3V03_04395 [Hyphomonadaceae bacterium]
MISFSVLWCDGFTAKSGLDPGLSGLAFLELAVEAVIQGEVFFPAVADHQSRDMAALLQIFQ